MKKDTKALCKKLIKQYDVMAKHGHNPKSTEIDKLASTRGFWGIFDYLFESTMFPNWEYIEEYNQKFCTKQQLYLELSRQSSFRPGAVTPELQKLAESATRNMHEACDMKEKTWKFIEEDSLRNICFIVAQVWGDEDELSQLSGFAIYKDSVLYELIYYAALTTERKKLIEKAIIWRKTSQATNHMRHYVDSGEQLFSESMKFLIDEYVLPHDVHHSINELNNKEFEERKKWAKENCKDAYFIGRRHALFQDNIDSMAFKLRWI